MDATERRRLGMLQHAAGFLRSFAGDRTGAVAWVARGIAATLQREAGGPVPVEGIDDLAAQVRAANERAARLRRAS